MQEKTAAVQSFNRVNDPVIDQDNAKIMGALGGGYGAWKHHGKSISKRKGIFDRLAGRVSAPVTRPLRGMVGAGLGALAAGTLARYVNKENKEDHQVDMAQAKAMQQPQYPMYSYASEKTANMYDTQEKTKTDKMLGKGIRGGLLGALASSILGGKAMKGAGIGALAGAGHEAYKQYEAQKDAPNQTEQIAMYPQYNNEDAMYDKYAHMTKEARLGVLFNKAITSLGGKAKKATSIAADRAAKALKTNAGQIKKEFINHAPGVDRWGQSLKKAAV